MFHYVYVSWWAKAERSVAQFHPCDFLLHPFILLNYPLNHLQIGELFTIE